MSTQSLTFALEGVSCAGCVAKIERHFDQQAGVILARGNATTGRMRMIWDPALQTAESLAEQIRDLGYDAHPFFENSAKPQERSLLPQLGLAGFAMMNIMAISFAVWAGIATDMGVGSRQFLHWVSAVLATPVVLYSGAVFFAPAYRALRKGHMNMDTPIALAILITYGASLFETIRASDDVYFDAVTSLIFFLLIGRVIEAKLKRRSSDASENLRSLMHITARRENTDGSLDEIAPEDLLIGDVVLVQTGERVPADGVLLSQHAQVDESAITGESLPRELTKGETITAGALVFAGPIRLQVTHVGEDAQIYKVAQMISQAAAHKGAIQKRADQFARGYIPLVLGGGGFGFCLWFFVFGASFADALMIAVAVLVVTCPCAAGLATPAVTSRAVNLLMSMGVIVKSGDALERLGDVDCVIADKTGTLTHPLPALSTTEDSIRHEAAQLAAGSTHPLAKMLCEGLDVQAQENLTEIPGQGILGTDGAKLGSAKFVGVKEVPDHPALWYQSSDGALHCFAFIEEPRENLGAFIQALKQRNLTLTLLSGDRVDSVAQFAQKFEIEHWRGEILPQGKLTFLEELGESGKKPLMFGDGINDAPALSGAYVSVSFASATEVAQVSADVVLTSPDPFLLPQAIDLARDSKKLIEENLWFSGAYNIVTVPLALAGYLSPLIAAILMSSSSIIVLINGLRLRRSG